MQHLALWLLCVWQCCNRSWSFSAPASPATSSTQISSSNPALKNIDNKSSARGRATVPSLNQQTIDAKKFPRTWVPIGSTLELDPDRPSPIEFLEQRYVTYQDNQGKWVFLDDACPHRLAPLSEGRIDREKNVVQCSYHGWEFSSEGTCQRIPQANTQLEESAKTSQRSSVASYPTFVQNQVLFVWPWPEDLLTFANETWRFPEGIMKGMNPIVSTFTRDLPYGWSQLVENLIDPSHVPFAHHGMQGKRTDAIPINMTVPDDHGEQGFSYEWEDRTMAMMRKGTGGFRAPYAVVYDADFQTTPTPRKFELSVLCIPTKPGWSRAIIVTTAKPEQGEPSSTSKQKKPRKSLVGRVFKALPVWIVHILNNRFLDSDLAFLHYQERELARPGNPRYYMPAPADRCIGALRKWISKYTTIHSEALPSNTMPRSELFNRYAQHTSHCKDCQEGLKSMQRWRKRLYATAALSIFGIKFAVAKVVLVVSIGMLQLFHMLETQLKVGEFKHYENH